MVIEGLKRAFSCPDSPLKIESGGVATVGVGGHQTSRTIGRRSHGQRGANSIIPEGMFKATVPHAFFDNEVIIVKILAKYFY